MYQLHKKIWFELTGKTIRLKPKKAPRGSVLLSYTTFPFLAKESTLSGHTNRFECREIARIFVERGYAVDVIDWTNKKFVPKKHYTYCIDIHDNLERLAPLLNKDCKKILHVTTSYWKFQNEAEKKRIEEVKNRKGVALTPRRQLTPSYGIEIADFVTMLGNNATEHTYSHAGKKIFRIPLSTTHTYPSPEQKDFETARKNFIWLGGAGMVHKGLDLTIEAFARMPEYTLNIFGNFHGETDFAEMYHRELYDTPNIKHFGKVNMGSSTFYDKAATSIALVHPSCSEGQSGAVITSLHAGLIPIISRESGVDCPDFGIVMHESTTDSIIAAVKTIAQKPAQELKDEAMRAWNYANTYHTKESFTRAYRAFVDILEGKQS